MFFSNELFFKISHMVNMDKRTNTKALWGSSFILWGKGVLRLKGLRTTGLGHSQCWMNNLNHYFPAARGLKLCQYPPLLPSPSSPIRGPGVTASRPLPSGPPPPRIPTSQPASQFPDTPLRYTHWAPPPLRAHPLQTPGTLGLPHPTLPFQHPYPPGRRQRRST